MSAIRYVPGWWPGEEDVPFTSAALKALDDVEFLATARNSPAKIQPVFVLWAVLRRRNRNGRLGLAVLEACGVDCISLAREIEEAMPASSGTGRPLRDFGDIYRLALRASEEALLLKHDWVGTEHLVLALFTAGDALTGQLFATHDLTSESFKQTLNELLRTWHF